MCLAHRHHSKFNNERIEKKTIIFVSTSWIVCISWSSNLETWNDIYIYLFVNHKVLRTHRWGNSQSDPMAKLVCGIVSGQCGRLGLLKQKSFHPSQSLLFPNLLAALCRPRCRAPVSTPLPRQRSEFGGKLRSLNAHVGLTLVGVTWVKHNISLLQFLVLQRCAVVFCSVCGLNWWKQLQFPTLRNVGNWISAGGFLSGPPEVRFAIGPIQVCEAPVRIKVVGGAELYYGVVEEEIVFWKQAHQSPRKEGKSVVDRRWTDWSSEYSGLEQQTQKTTVEISCNLGFGEHHFNVVVWWCDWMNVVSVKPSLWISEVFDV